MSSLLLAVPRPKKPLKNKSGTEASHLLHHLVSLSAQTSLGNKVRPKMESNLRIPLTYILAHTKPGDVVVGTHISTYTYIIPTYIYIGRPLWWNAQHGAGLSTYWQTHLRTEKTFCFEYTQEILDMFLLQLFSYLQSCEFDVQCFDYAMKRLKLDLARVVW